MRTSLHRSSEFLKRIATADHSRRSVSSSYDANSSSNAFEQFARLLHLALVAPEAREAHGGAEFPRLGLLLACESECALEIVYDVG